MFIVTNCDKSQVYSANGGTAGTLMGFEQTQKHSPTKDLSF